MAAYEMVVAQLLFDDNDHVWHLHSENWRPENERVMDATWQPATEILPNRPLPSSEERLFEQWKE